MKIHIWEVQHSPEWFWGLSVLYRDHRKVSGGPSGGATCPGGLDGLKMGGNQPLVGLCAPPQGPKAPRVENPRGGGRLHLAWGASLPSWPPPPSRWDLEGPAPSPLHPINRAWVGGLQHPFPGAAPPSSNTSSSSVALGEALPENCKLQHHAVVLPEFFPNFSFPLAGSRRRRRP